MLLFFQHSSSLFIFNLVIGSGSTIFCYILFWLSCLCNSRLCNARIVILILLFDSSMDFQVCGLNIASNVVEIIFHVFDTNCDGGLTIDEFIRVLHRRERDIAQPMESGLIRFLSRCWDSMNNRSFARFLPLTEFPES